MKHISSYLTKSGLQRRPSTDWLTASWLRAAPPTLQQVCRPTLYHENSLTLQVESSVWLSRLRQQQKSLIRHLRHTREFAALGKIKLEVSPRQLKPRQRKSGHHHQKLSARSKKNLLNSAAHLSDPELRHSLERLVRTASES